MKIVGKYLKRVINEEGKMEISFLIENYRNQQMVKELEKDVNYRLSIDEVKSKRSVEANKFMWACIHDISEKINGSRASDDDDWQIYLNALERAGAKFEYIACLPESEALLKQQFRAVKLMSSFEHNNKMFNSYKVYYGSSKMNASEFNKLVEVVLDMAEECGIDTTYYGG